MLREKGDILSRHRLSPAPRLLHFLSFFSGLQFPLLFGDLVPHLPLGLFACCYLKRTFPHHLMCLNSSSLIIFQPLTVFISCAVVIIICTYFWKYLLISYLPKLAHNIEQGKDTFIFYLFCLVNCLMLEKYSLNELMNVWNCSKLMSVVHYSSVRTKTFLGPHLSMSPFSQSSMWRIKWFCSVFKNKLSRCQFIRQSVEKKFSVMLVF